uniref:Uncharacterized protein n=1 Tax=Acrobeloides nanus TaxID=290746 RepID=A0A914DBD7_9BILA
MTRQNYEISYYLIESVVSIDRLGWLEGMPARSQDRLSRCSGWFSSIDPNNSVCMIGTIFRLDQHSGSLDSIHSIDQLVRLDSLDRLARLAINL